MNICSYTAIAISVGFITLDNQIFEHLFPPLNRQLAPGLGNPLQHASTYKEDSIHDFLMCSLCIHCNTMWSRGNISRGYRRSLWTNHSWASEYPIWITFWGESNQNRGILRLSSWSTDFDNFIAEPVLHAAEIYWLGEKTIRRTQFKNNMIHHRDVKCGFCRNTEMSTTCFADALLNFGSYSLHHNVVGW